MTPCAIAGAFAFPSSEARQAALDRALQPLLPSMDLGVCSPATRALLQASVRGDQLLVFAPQTLTFAAFDELVPRVYQLAEAAERGRVGLRTGGEAPELMWAEPPGAYRSDALPAAHTATWLRPSGASLWVERSGGSPLEFRWTHAEGLPNALDVRDWCGIFGVLVERDHRIFFGAPDLTGPLSFFAWADLARPGSAGLVAFAHQEQLVYTEVAETAALMVHARSYAAATRVVVTTMLLPDAGSHDWPAVERPPRNLWWVEGHGIVALA